MRAIILAAGRNRRLGLGDDVPVKILLHFGRKSLLQRHLEILQYCGIQEVVVAVGYRADEVRTEIAAIGAEHYVRTVFNPDYELGSIVTLWTLRDELTWGGGVILMDGDVLYDYRLMERLLSSEHQNCFLLDRDIEPGEEPTKLCIRDGYLVDFHKLVRTKSDYYGESVGFFRLSAPICRLLVPATRVYLDAGKTGELYDEALRDVLLDSPPGTFGVEDVTGLPWIEIDFPDDIRRAREEVLPCLVDLEPHSLTERLDLAPTAGEASGSL
jgi:choline kinase